MPQETLVVVPVTVDVGKRSRVKSNSHEAWGRKTRDLDKAGGGKPIEDLGVAALETEGVDDGQDALGVATAGDAVGADAHDAPEDDLANAALGMIVGRRCSLVVEEGPEFVLALQQKGTDAYDPIWGRMVSGINQQPMDLLSHRR